MQKGDYTHASQTAALVPPGFQANVVTSANVSTQGSLGNQFYGITAGAQIVAPALYRTGDPRMPVDSTRPGSTLNGVPYIVQAKYKTYGDPIRLASCARGTVYQCGSGDPR